MSDFDILKIITPNSELTIHDYYIYNDHIDTRYICFCVKDINAIHTYNISNIDYLNTFAENLTSCKSIKLECHIPNLHLLVDKCEKFSINMEIDPNFTKQMIEQDKIHSVTLINYDIIEDYFGFDFRDTIVYCEIINSECIVPNNFKIKKLSMSFRCNYYSFDNCIRALENIFNNNDIEYFKILITGLGLNSKDQRMLLDFCKTLDIKVMELNCKLMDEHNKQEPVDYGKSLINMGVFSKIMLLEYNHIYENIDLDMENYKLLDFSLWVDNSKVSIQPDVKKLIKRNNKNLNDTRFRRTKLASN